MSDDGGGERGERGGAVRRCRGRQVQDEEAGHRAVADVGERERDARGDDRRGMQRPRRRVARARPARAVGDAPRDERAEQRPDRGERPDRVVAAAPSSRLADDRPDGQPAPDRQAEEPDRLAAPRLGREVDDPSSRRP